MRWTLYGADIAYARNRQGRRDWDTTLLKTYRCPHSNFSERHRKVGQTHAQPFVENSFARGFGAAYSRMIEEAVQAGAHGVIGVVDRTNTILGDQIREFHVYGTAVEVEGEKGGSVWSTYLAGQKLVLLRQAGYSPVAIVAAMASIRVNEVCTTSVLMHGGWDRQGVITPDMEITQMSEAHMAVRRRARENIGSCLRQASPEGGLLHGVSTDITEREVGEADRELTCLLRGNAVREHETGRRTLRPDEPVATIRLG
jgi:uncharacterized protein YbjQ (UPF0145 family)